MGLRGSVREFLAGLAIAGLGFAAAPSFAAPPANLGAILTLPAAPSGVQTPEQALAQDAAEYARLYGVDQDEAVRRLRAQAETVAETDRLQDLYRNRLAGISIEHWPTYRIVVLLTGTKPVRQRTVRAGGMAVTIVFRTFASDTL